MEQTTYKFQDICETTTDYVANGSFKTLADNVQYSDKRDYARLIRLVDFNNNYDEKNAIWVPESSYNFLKKSALFGDEVIISNVGANLGTVFKCPKLTYPMTLGPNSVLVKTNNLCNQNYLYYYLKSKTGYSKLMALVSGSAMPKFNKTELRNMEITLPDRKYQDKAAEILIKIDEKIELNNKINKNLQDLINNIFISKFVNYDDYVGEYKSTEVGNIPNNWSIDDFGNVISFSNGYGWDSKDMLENGKPNTYKVFKMGNIKIGGGINKDKTKSWILKDKCNGLEQYLSKKGDILMCMTDMKSSENPLLGHTALIDRDDEFVINQRVGLIRCNKNIKWPYIYTMTNLPFFINDIRSRAHSGVQVNLTTSGICNTKMVVPDNDSLNAFYKIATPIYEKMFALNNEIESLAQLRDTLLPKLINGELDLDKIEL